MKWSLLTATLSALMSTAVALQSHMSFSYSGRFQSYGICEDWCWQDRGDDEATMCGDGACDDCCYCCKYGKCNDEANCDNGVAATPPSKEASSLNSSVTMNAIPRPFVVISTQRSGSSWTMDLLGTQDGIGMPGGSNHTETQERMLPVHRANYEHWNDFPWKAWQAAAENAFAEVLASKPAALAVGWKLQYDQIPAPLVDHFVTWARNNSIRVVHLVREASLLRKLSSNDAHRTHVYHSYSDDESNATQALAPVWPKVGAAREICEQHHREVAFWSNRLPPSDMNFHYASYERLMFDPVARSALFTFVSGRQTAIDSISTEDAMVTQERLHPFKCSQRLANFSLLIADLRHEPSCNETVAACDYLEQQH